MSDQKNALMPGFGMLTDMGGYAPWQAGTSGSLTAYQPTLRDRLANVLMGDQRPSPERNRLVEGLTGSRGMGTTSFGLLEVVPGGQVFSAQDAWRGGDDMALAMALLPAIKSTKGPSSRWFHGSNVDFDKFDPSLVGSGAWGRVFHAPPKHKMFFLADNPRHAQSYGTPRQFDVDGNFMQVNAADDLELWAKELKFNDAQSMIDKYFDGSIYKAIDADRYFNDAFSMATKGGFDGAIVDFGRYVGDDGAASGKTLILGNPSLPRRVRD